MVLLGPTNYMSLLIKTLKCSKQNSVINGLRFHLLKTEWGKIIKKMIWAYHRYTLGKCWSQPKIYLHPLHQLVGKGKKGSVTWTASEGI